MLEALRQVERHGFDTVGVSFRQLEGKLWEIKVGAIRILYTVLSGPELVLLHLYRKQGQKMPLDEKAVALRRMKERVR